VLKPTAIVKAVERVVRRAGTSTRALKQALMTPVTDGLRPLLLAAFPPELAGLDQDPPSGWQVRCAGVGAVTAAAKTAGLLAKLKPSHVLFVGTCGAYDQPLAVGDLIEADEALSVSLEEVARHAYRPAIERVRWPATLAFPVPLELPVHAVAVPMTLTRTLEGANRLASLAPVGARPPLRTQGPGGRLAQALPPPRLSRIGSGVRSRRG